MAVPEIPASHRDLLAARTATLATIDHDGRPQLSAVWFLADDGVIRISLCHDRWKVRNLLRNPAVGFLVLDPASSARYLEVRGDAEVVVDEGCSFARRVGAKYGGIDLRTFDAPGSHRVVVTVHPTRVHAVDLRG